ncbi:MAG: hypothetical protein ACLPUT_03500 [Solirubrobacteraceae bacterium]
MLVAATITIGTAAASTAAARIGPEFLFSGPNLPPVDVSIKMPSTAAPTLIYYRNSHPDVECETATGSGEILDVSGIAWMKSVALTYEECKAPGFEKTCSVNGSKLHGSLKVTGAEGEIGYYEPGSPDVLLHMKTSSGTFTEIEFSGTPCPVTAGKYVVKKGVIGEIPGPYIDTSLTSFREVLGVNGSLEQLFKEIEDNLTTTVDELKIGTTPVAVKGELEFTLVGSDSVTIFT